MNNQSKLNWLTSHILPGDLALQHWLVKNGISHSLTQKYFQNGWLNKLFTGVYYRPDPKNQSLPDWIDALQALTQQLHLPIHLSGLSSLTYQGLNHYLPLTTQSAWVSVKNKQSLPKWFKEFPEQHWLYCFNSKLKDLGDKDLMNLDISNKQIRSSIPELAAYEVVDSIGKYISFEHTAEIFQGLINLSPRKVQSLLSRSTAVATNRIFLFLSHYYNHSWVKYLDETKIELGVGKRQVVVHGSYDERYKITVPHSLAANKNT